MLLAEGVVEVGGDEGVEVARKYVVWVAAGVASAKVFDLFVRVQHVAANLVSPRRLLIWPFQLAHFFGMLL